MARRFVTYPSLKRFDIPYTNDHLRRMEAKGQFPPRIAIGPGRIGWDEAEVEAYVREKLEAGPKKKLAGN